MLAEIVRPSVQSQIDDLRRRDINIVVNKEAAYETLSLMGFADEAMQQPVTLTAQRYRNADGLEGLSTKAAGLIDDLAIYDDLPITLHFILDPSKSGQSISSQIAKVLLEITPETQAAFKSRKDTITPEMSGRYPLPVELAECIKSCSHYDDGLFPDDILAIAEEEGLVDSIPKATRAKLEDEYEEVFVTIRNGKAWFSFI